MQHHVDQTHILVLMIILTFNKCQMVSKDWKGGYLNSVLLWVVLWFIK